MLYTPKQSISHCQRGAMPSVFIPGDFILVADNSFHSRLIAFGQRLRFGKSPYTKWTHCAMIVNPQGDLIEATAKNVLLTNLSKYEDKEYLHVAIEATLEDRHEAVTFAQSCLGQRYGWVTIISIAISLLSGLKFSFNVDGQEICSGLVARALERTSAIFPRDPSHITPSMLAAMYLEAAST